MLISITTVDACSAYITLVFEFISVPFHTRLEVHIFRTV